MQHGQNGYRLCFKEKIYAVRELVKKRSAHATLYQRKLPRIIFDSTEDESQFIKELTTKTRSLIFIPKSCCLDVEFGLRLDGETSNHESGYRLRSLSSMSARTSDQTLPAEGLAR